MILALARLVRVEYHGAWVRYLDWAVDRDYMDSPRTQRWHRRSLDRHMEVLTRMERP